jgi:putative membrane protein
MSHALYGTTVIAQRWDWDGHMGGGWWILMGIGMLLVWVLIILAIVWLVRSLIAGRPADMAPSAGETTPLEILDRRLAEGSISLEEYDERRRVLSGSTGARGDER